MFLEKLLPSEGMYCVALALQGGGFRHFFHAELSAVRTQIAALDSAGHTAYIAQATYDKTLIEEAAAHNAAIPRGLPKDEWRKQAKKRRSHTNAKYLKNFFLDIDVGEKWPLKSQKDGVTELKKFVTETGLPFPTVVSSGNGLYAHWILDEAIPSQQWRTIAFLLKQVVAAYSPALGGDASRTADAASVLRPPGTTNRKPGKPEKPVRIAKEVDAVRFLDFVDCLSKAAAKKKISRAVTQTPKPAEDVNADFYEGTISQGPPSVASKVADRCGQLGYMRDTAGDISEPLWYACIGVIIHCQDGDDIVHQWSAGHPQYSTSETDSKIAQWRATGMGPSTCVTLAAANPEKCIGCPHNGKVRSPIVLGKPDPEVKELPPEQVDAPEGFRRGQDGLYVNIDDRWVRFYDQDLFVESLSFDESLGYEVMTIKHSLPFDGMMECVIRSSVVNDQKAFISALADNHVKVVGNKEKKIMTAYCESYQAKLQRQRSMNMLMCQMGWKKTRNGEICFVLGKKIVNANGPAVEASLARNVPKAAQGFRAEGSLDKWKTITRTLGDPGMEPMAFGFTAGAFAPLLMKFTGFDGAVLSLMGESGAGKTLLLRMIESVWGNHQELIMLRADTGLALVSRLGVYGNLPLAVDEVTNLDGVALSDFVYQATQGRERVRLTRSAEERKNINSWNTIVVTTANASIIDKLSGLKADASAEMNRVFEYEVSKHPSFCEPLTTEIYWTITENFGLAGEIYAQYLVQHANELRDLLTKVRTQIEIESDARGEERFWYAIVACTIVGGLIAKKLGLVDYEIDPLRAWACDMLRDMRRSKIDSLDDPVSLLGQFFDEHAANRILVKQGPTPGSILVMELPRGPLVWRYDMGSNKAYISRAVMKHWIAKKYGSYTMIKKYLMDKGVLKNANAMRTLGAGSYFKSSGQQCWEIDMSSPHLGKRGKEVAQEALVISQRAPLPEEAVRLKLIGGRK